MRIYAPNVEENDVSDISDRYIQEVIQMRRNAYHIKQIQEKDIELQAKISSMKSLSNSVSDSLNILIERIQTFLDFIQNPIDDTTKQKIFHEIEGIDQKNLELKYDIKFTKSKINKLRLKIQTLKENNNKIKCQMYEHRNNIGKLKVKIFNISLPYSKRQKKHEILEQSYKTLYETNKNSKEKNNVIQELLRFADVTYSEYLPKLNSYKNSIFLKKNLLIRTNRNVNHYITQQNNNKNENLTNRLQCSQTNNEINEIITNNNEIEKQKQFIESELITLMKNNEKLNNEINICKEERSKTEN